jgi:hypothetical protein
LGSVTNISTSTESNSNTQEIEYPSNHSNSSNTEYHTIPHSLQCDILKDTSSTNAHVESTVTDKQERSTNSYYQTGNCYTLSSTLPGNSRVSTNMSASGIANSSRHPAHFQRGSHHFPSTLHNHSNTSTSAPTTDITHSPSTFMHTSPTKFILPFEDYTSMLSNLSRHSSQTEATSTTHEDDSAIKATSSRDSSENFPVVKKRRRSKYRDVDDTCSIDSRDVSTDCSTDLIGRTAYGRDLMITSFEVTLLMFIACM